MSICHHFSTFYNQNKSVEESLIKIIIKHSSRGMLKIIHFFTCFFLLSKITLICNKLLLATLGQKQTVNTIQMYE